MLHYKGTIKERQIDGAFQWAEVRYSLAESVFIFVIRCLASFVAYCVAPLAKCCLRKSRAPRTVQRPDKIPKELNTLTRSIPPLLKKGTASSLHIFNVWCPRKTFFGERFHATLLSLGLSHFPWRQVLLA